MKTYKKEKRVVFQKGKQFRFLNEAREKIGFSWPLFAKQFQIHPRSLNDWKREKYFLPYVVVKKMCKQLGLAEPKNIEIREPFWSTQKAGRVAGKVVFEKYGVIGGDQEYRKKKWREWWDKEGKYKSTIPNTPKAITKPAFSEQLAEFVGIVLGDGGISRRQVVITLHHEDDKDYGEYVSNLIKELFDVPVSRYHRKKNSTNNYVISRCELVKFCTDELGLNIGSKVRQQVDIPEWIKGNKKYSVACLRGLFDTDGCIFNETHRINGRIYSYPRFTIVNHSLPMTATLYNILEELGFNPKFRKDNRKVQLEKKDEIIRYFKEIESRNQKHLKRFESIMRGGVG